MENHVNLPLPRHDRLAHFWYGANICAASSLASRLAFRIFPQLVDLLNGVAVMLACLAIGLIVCSVFAAVKEWVLDAGANEKAIAAGLPPPHGVERADAAWTIYGGLCVAVPPMLLMYF